MKVRSWNSQSGQALVWVAASLLILMLFAALAIEAGHVYTVRRQMQNAADAGALAGARELCLGHDEDSAEAVARTYAVDNNHADGALSRFDANEIEGTVDVTALHDTSLFFAPTSDLPWGPLPVGAQARARCGRAGNSCGLWPVAFDERIWNTLLGEEVGGSYAGCGKTFRVWTSKKMNEDNNDVFTEEWPGCMIDGAAKTELCDCFQCDTPGMRIIAGGDRGWLDFSDVPVEPPYPEDSCIAPGCGATELKCHILDEETTPIQLPACIPGDSGVKAGVKQSVEARKGDTVKIPLFSRIGCPDARACTNPKSMTYYVERFGCVTVVGWDQNFEIDPEEGAQVWNAEKGKWENAKKIKGKAIEVAINCNGCSTNCGSGSNTPPEEWEVGAVSLVPIPNH